MVGEIARIGQLAPGFRVIEHRERPVVGSDLEGMGMANPLRPFQGEGGVHFGTIVVAVGSDGDKRSPLHDFGDPLLGCLGEVVLGDLGDGGMAHAAPAGGVERNQCRKKKGGGDPCNACFHRVIGLFPCKIMKKNIYLCKCMEVRAKKALGQHFLTDQAIAKAIVDALPVSEEKMPVLEIGPGMGVLTQYLLPREDLDLKLVEIDGESVDYLLTHFPGMQGRLYQADFLKLPLDRIMPGTFSVIGNFPYNISSQIFFKILDNKDRIPEVVCMIQKEVAERIAEKPGTKTYGILSVLLQAWYDIEYLFTVGSGAFAPPPKVQSAVIRLCRNGRKDLGCDEKLFKTVVKTAFGQRRKTLRNSLKPVIQARLDSLGEDPETFKSNPVFDLRPERLGVEDFISLTRLLTPSVPLSH